MILQNIYTSIACNCTPECADWSHHEWLVYGASHAVCIYAPRFMGHSAKIDFTYVRHTKRVNTVQFIRPSPTLEHISLFLSGAEDCLSLLWDITDPSEPLCYSLKGHESGIKAVTGIYETSSGNNKLLLLATASADSTIKLWHFDLNVKEAFCFQTISLASGFCFAVRFQRLPETDYTLLAYSSDDESISLWSKHCSSLEFKHLHKLRGHEDWVRGLDFVQQENDLLLASCAQDNFIRLWRISRRTQSDVERNRMDFCNLTNMDELRVEEDTLELGKDCHCAVSLESVLCGHDGWVYSVQWHNSNNSGLRLLSASIDKTLIVWAPTDSGVWMEQVRVGDVGGNSLGFFGGKFSNDGKSIFGHSYQGGFHMWTQSTENENVWLPDVIIGGHYGAVRDLAWEPKGAYLMSVSADQTTRIHAPWATGMTIQRWHELARPQVHGYDMQALAIISRYKFASGAEEKIVRTFQASTNFVENLRRIAKVVDDDCESADTLLTDLPKGAAVPSLGLSNKAVYDVETQKDNAIHNKDAYPANYFIATTLNRPPQEETLMQNTLWPEVQKLYGHGYEIYALAASPDGQLLASSCKATNPQHAQIILWNTQNWKQIQQLFSHQLTVTQMSFSPDNRYLLSVSRDRRWTLFERMQESDVAIATAALPQFVQVATTDRRNGIHTRIIWSCDWSHDSIMFATASRDGALVLWGKNNARDTTRTQETNDDVDVAATLNGWKPKDILRLKNDSITAVAFAKHCFNNDYAIAIGLETGAIEIYGFDTQLMHKLHINHDKAHHLTVKRLQFRPEAENNNELYLASCGDDHFVKIYKISRSIDII